MPKKTIIKFSCDRKLCTKDATTKSEAAMPMGWCHFYDENSNTHFFFCSGDCCVEWARAGK